MTPAVRAMTEILAPVFARYPGAIGLLPRNEYLVLDTEARLHQEGSLGPCWLVYRGREILLRRVTELSGAIVVMAAEHGLPEEPEGQALVQAAASLLLLGGYVRATEPDGF